MGLRRSYTRSQILRYWGGNVEKCIACNNEKPSLRTHKEGGFFVACGACFRHSGHGDTLELAWEKWDNINKVATDEEAYKAVEEETKHMHHCIDCNKIVECNVYNEDKLMFSCNYCGQIIELKELHKACENVQSAIDREIFSTKPLCQQCLRENEDGDDHLCTLCRGKEFFVVTGEEFENFIRACNEPSEPNEALRSLAPKNDQDVYEKVDLSLIPWDILSDQYKEGLLFEVLKDVHSFLNGGPAIDHIPMLQAMIKKYSAKPLAINLGFGVEKYYRDSWKKGFGGDEKRILEALLRHGDKRMRGEKFDKDKRGAYHKGCSHIGAVMWGLMVAEQESKVDKT